MPIDQEALQGLANELTSALADMVVAVQEGQAHVGDIGATLAEMLDLARAAKDKPAPEAPQVNVTVQPAEVKFLPGPTHDFEVTHTYDGDGRIQKSYMKRVSKE